MARLFQTLALIMEDLDLDVEEEEHKRGIEPPAHWPSRDSKVEVENLTCHYAPQVSSTLDYFGGNAADNVA